MTKRPKHSGTKAAKIARSSAADELIRIWTAQGFGPARNHAIRHHAARFDNSNGRYQVNMLGLTVEHAASTRMALRRWCDLTRIGAHGYHPAPSRPDETCRTISIVQNRIGSPTQRERDARGSIAILEEVSE